MTCLISCHEGLHVLFFSSSGLLSKFRCCCFFLESVLFCILYPLFYVLFNMTGNPVLGDGYRERKKKIIYIRGDVVTRYNAV